jgi:flagellin-like protein
MNMRRSNKRGIVGIEAAIVLIAFVIVAAAFAFMVVNMGLTSTGKSKEAIQQGLKEASCPLTLDGSMLLKSESANNVSTIIIPLKTLGVKYVPMWTNETVVSIKIGTRVALANIYNGINHNVDPTGMSFDEVTTRLTIVKETITLDGNGKGTLSEKPILPGSVTITVVGGSTFTDDGAGNWTLNPQSGEYINYKTGELVLEEGKDKAVVASYEKIVNSVSVVGEKDTINDNKITLDRTPVVPGSVTITVGTTVYTDNGNGTLSLDGSKINYLTGEVTLPGKTGSAVSNYKYVVETKAVLVVENDNHDDSLDFFEKGYLIIELDASQRAFPRDNVLIEVRPEKSAPLTIEFTVPEAIPANAYVTIE